MIIFWSDSDYENEIFELISNIIDKIDNEPDIEILIINNKNIYNQTNKIYQCREKVWRYNLGNKFRWKGDFWRRHRNWNYVFKIEFYYNNGR